MSEHERYLPPLSADNVMAPDNAIPGRCATCASRARILDEPDGDGCLVWEATTPDDGFCHLYYPRAEAERVIWPRKKVRDE